MPPIPPMPPMPPISGIAGAAAVLDSGSGLSHIAASVVINNPAILAAF